MGARAHQAAREEPRAASAVTQTASPARRGPALALAAVLVLGAIAFWLVRRGRRAGAGSLAEAACPACLTLAVLAERPAELRAVAVDVPPPGPALEHG